MFQCYGSIALKNNCKNKVDKKNSLCNTCKKEYWNNTAGEKKYYNIKQMQNRLLEIAEDLRTDKITGKNNIDLIKKTIF